MSKPDQAAEHPVPIESVGEMGMSRPAENVSLVPIEARFGIEQRPQPFAIESSVRTRCGRTEELPEILIAGEGAYAGKLELEKRQMRLIEIDGIDLRGLGR